MTRIVAWALVVAAVGVGVWIVMRERPAPRLSKGERVVSGLSSVASIVDSIAGAVASRRAAGTSPIPPGAPPPGPSAGGAGGLPSTGGAPSGTPLQPRF